MSHTRISRPLAFLGAMLLVHVGWAATAMAVERDAFRVCADPNNLPFSNADRDGFENRLAELWAGELGLELEYTWFPQRRGFIRNTLRAPAGTRPGYKCDVVMGVVDGFERVITTKPYYRSTYALVYVRGRGLDEVRSPRDFLNLDPQQREKLRVGAFTQTPGSLWLARYGMIEQIVTYQVLDADPAAYPGEIVEKDLVAGKLDAAILWGPIAGFFAKRAEDVDIELILLQSESDIRFDFAISAGVRFGEGEAKRELEALMDKTGERIEALLREYHIPLIAEDGSPL